MGIKNYVNIGQFKQGKKHSGPNENINTSVKGVRYEKDTFDLNFLIL